MRPALLAYVMTLAVGLSSAAAETTDEEKCQGRKLSALGKRELCLRKARQKILVGKPLDPDLCDRKFDAAIVRADEAAAKKGVWCRWLEEGDGTAIDLNTGLQWELKTTDGSVHDLDNSDYTWTATFQSTMPDGSVFAEFLGTLNGGLSPDGVTTTGCFANKCDWRVPTTAELRGILDMTVPGCLKGTPCTTMPGETKARPYWSATTSDRHPDKAWVTSFWYGDSGVSGKWKRGRVRAVRGSIGGW